MGDKVDAFVTNADKAARRIGVSIKALEIAEEKQAVAQYGSSDSGASLGDIFKAAIKKRETADSCRRGAARSRRRRRSEPARAIEAHARTRDHGAAGNPAALTFRRMCLLPHVLLKAVATLPNLCERKALSTHCGAGESG